MTFVRVQRWTVLSRATDKDGHIVRGEQSYKRTGAPQEERTERVVRFDSRARVTLTWGGADGPAVASALFALRTGRMIGNANWLIHSLELKDLRKLAREAFPKAAPEPAEAPAAESS